MRIKNCMKILRWVYHKSKLLDNFIIFFRAWKLYGNHFSIEQTRILFLFLCSARKHNNQGLLFYKKSHAIIGNKKSLSWTAFHDLPKKLMY